MLAGGDVVPIPGRPGFVVMADLAQGETPRLPERLGQREDRRLGRQRCGEVDDLDGPRGNGTHQIAQHAHAERLGTLLAAKQWTSVPAVAKARRSFFSDGGAVASAGSRLLERLLQKLF